MNTIITIALDAMGGDVGAAVVVPAALEHLRQDLDIKLILVGDEDRIRQLLPNGDLPERLQIQHASQQVEMDDLPSRALRNKKDSSMRVAINLVKSGEADACVSSGNTGALMATARFVLKMLPAVSRPAIITSLPGLHERTWVLDLGANIDCTANNLYEFAVMGAELVSAVENCPSPTVGLLNIGQEEIKGNEQVKQADVLLNNSGLNYIGFVEGDDIYLKENLDVVVTDGFVGNVALKTSEGVAKMITSSLRTEFNRNIFTRISALFAWPVLAGLKKRIDPRRYNGAALLGLRGIVVKSHGGADQLAFSNAIGIAKKEVIADVAARIEAGVGRQLDTRAQA